MPDATTIWLFREALVEAGLIDKLFDRFSQHLRAKGYIAPGGQIVDATSCRRRSSATPSTRTRPSRLARRWGSGRRNQPKNAQKDKDARWTKKHGQSFYGYKNHIGLDKLHKIIRKWAATASMSIRKSSHGTAVLTVSSGSPLALIATSRSSTSKKPACRTFHPDLRPLCGRHRVRLVLLFPEAFFRHPFFE